MADMAAAGLNIDASEVIGLAPDCEAH